MLMAENKFNKQCSEKDISKQLYERLVSDYAPLVSRIARKQHQRLPKHIELDDLVSAGTLGLIDAIKRFDPSYDNSFKTYAEYRIKGAILDFLRDWDSLPRSVRDFEKKIQQVRKNLEASLGRVPTRSEISKSMNLIDSQIDQLEITLHSTPVHFQSATFSTNVENIASEGQLSILSLLIETETNQSIMKWIELLPEPMRTMLKLHYFDNLSLKNIAKLFNVTESRVSQIHHEALAKLRQKTLSEAG